jgi:hypothetical protein
MTLAADVTAKKGDTILQVFPTGTTWEIAVVSWGKKRATFIRKELIGLPAEEWSRYHMYLKDGKFVHKYPIESSSHYYKNI